MPGFHVTKSILIEKPLDDVRTAIVDFREWPTWSPWLVLEPDTQLDFSENQGDVGSHYSWNGKMLGTGKLTISGLTDYMIDMDLQFLTPFKSKARTYFTFKDENGATRLHWNMDSSLPFFMFFMTKQMAAWIGMDYQRGLAMLKEYVETGNVSSKLELVGESYLQATRYTGIRESCKISEIGEVMPQHFEKLSHWLDENNLSKDIVPFGIYHKMDMLSQTISFTSAIPIPDGVDCPFECGEIPAMKCLQVNHTGSYHHLGNAWSLLSTYMRSSKIKAAKQPMGYEFYINDPAIVPAQELMTQVFVPLR